MNRVIWAKQIENKNKKWYEFWKPAWILKKYYLRVKNGFVVIDEEVSNESK